LKFSAGGIRALTMLDGGRARSGLTGVIRGWGRSLSLYVGDMGGEAEAVLGCEKGDVGVVKGQLAESGGVGGMWPAAVAVDRTPSMSSGGLTRPVSHIVGRSTNGAALVVMAWGGL
jgi:hypothetical protein